MKKLIAFMVMGFISAACQAGGKALFTHEGLVETNRPPGLIQSGIPIEAGKKIELSFLGRTAGKHTIEENERIRLMDLRGVAARIRIRFQDETGNELKKTDIDVPVLSQAFTNYVRVFYPPPKARTLSLALLSGESAMAAVKTISISTDLTGQEAACVNVHPTFEFGDLNAYGYRSGYGGGLYTRPDGKTVWNSGFTGTTPPVPVIAGRVYDFYCRGKNGEPKSFIYMQFFNAEADKPFRTIKYESWNKGDAAKIKMPAGAVSVQLTGYYVILEEFRVTESTATD
jgi:hypothetical protein